MGYSLTPLLVCLARRGTATVRTLYVTLRPRSGTPSTGFFARKQETRTKAFVGFDESKDVFWQSCFESVRSDAIQFLIVAFEFWPADPNPGIIGQHLNPPNRILARHIISHTVQGGRPPV